MKYLVSLLCAPFFFFFDLRFLACFSVNNVFLYKNLSSLLEGESWDVLPRCGVHMLLFWIWGLSILLGQ